MRDETWLDAFDHALEAGGVAAVDRTSARVETEGFLAEADVSAFDHFGPPDAYAAELAAALSGDDGAGRRERAGVGRVAIEVGAVAKSYRGAAALQEVSLSVTEGEVVVLTGPNGAGKSTLLRILAGLERPDTGTVALSGAVGYVPQRGGLDPYLTAGEHFELFGAPTGMSGTEARQEGNRLARELGWEADSSLIAKELSGGTAQKLAVITALLAGPEILLLDEPYQGMDADSQHRFWSLLWTWQESGHTAVVSSHSTDALTKASRVVEIEGLTLR